MTNLDADVSQPGGLGEKAIEKRKESLLIVLRRVGSPKCGICWRGEAFGMSIPAEYREWVEDSLAVNFHESADGAVKALGVCGQGGPKHCGDHGLLKKMPNQQVCPR